MPKLRSRRATSVATASPLQRPMARAVSAARLQVAGDDRLQTCVGERFADPLGLPAAAGAEGRVELTLHAHLGVPHRLAMANDDDARHLRVERIRPFGHRHPASRWF